MKTLDECLTEEVFEPLANYLVYNPVEIEEFQEIVNKYGLPEQANSNKNFSSKKGLVLETYIIYSLLKFKQDTKTIHPVRNLEKLGPKNTVRRTKWGNYEFEPSKYWKGKTEIDALFEYHFYQDDVPIIFEITFTKSKKNRELKKKIIHEILKIPPYYCKIRPVKDEEVPGAYRLNSARYDRKILIPRPVGFEKILEK